MKTRLQAMATAALAVVSATAFADISLPNSDNGELTLIVWDQTLGTSYVRGLGVRINDIATKDAIIADTDFTPGSTLFHLPSITLTADANLQTFLAMGTGDFITWGVLGGAIGPGPTNALGARRFVSTATIVDDTLLVQHTQNARLVQQFSALQVWDQQFSGAIRTDNNGDTTVGNMQSSSNAGFTSPMANWGGPLSNQAALGGSANFYLLSTSGGPFNFPARVYVLEGLTLTADGTLTSVPLPAALWLFGSGIGVLVGSGRQKKLRQ